MYSVYGNVNLYNHHRKLTGVPQKLKIELTCVSIPIAGCIHKRNVISVSDSYLHSHVHCSIIHNSQTMTSNYVFISRCMDKVNLVYIFKGILFSLWEEGNPIIYDDMSKRREYYTKWHKPDSNTTQFHLYVESKKINNPTHRSVESGVMITRNLWCMRLVGWSFGQRTKFQLLCS